MLKIMLTQIFHSVYPLTNQELNKVVQVIKNFMAIENKKVLLVGGSGFIGHNLALFLKEKI